MNTWKPIELSTLNSLIHEGELQLQPQLKQFWESVKIQPVKWACPPIGDEGGGFWVVAIEGNSVVWFDDVEDGWNVADYETEGTLCESGFFFEEIQHAIGKLLNMSKELRVADDTVRSPNDAI